MSSLMDRYCKTSTSLYCVARCKSWINGRIAGEQAFSVLKLDETQGQSYLFMASKEKSKPSS
jgi:hypothetical protein